MNSIALTVPDPETYVAAALEMDIATARLISPRELVFDMRTLLKCCWGCEGGARRSEKCAIRHDSYAERVEMVRSYSRILVLHGHGNQSMSRAVLEIERRAFLDGHHLAFGIRHCSLCKRCALFQGKPCIQPEKIRPCEAIFGIDVFSTARNLGLPCHPLRDRDAVQNRYGFVCLF